MMKREAALLLTKASDSLVLAIELFNRPHDRGRASSTLILLDHGFEMLMKAAILHRGGRIREKRAKETIGFDACVRRSLSDGHIKYLTKEQALGARTINGLRDAAQHHLLDIREGQLYVHMQSGLTLFRDILKSVFNQDLASHLPTRVLPVSTSPPTDLATLFDSEVKEIKKLLQPGRRRRMEALARLRPLAILDGTIRDVEGQPSDSDLSRIAIDVSKGKSSAELFVGAAALRITTDGVGLSMSLRLTKSEGIPIRCVPEGTPDASVVATRRVDELGFYSLGAKRLAEEVGQTMPKALAVVDYLDLRRDPEYYKEIKIGKAVFKRYSQKVIPVIAEALKQTSADEIWRNRPAKARRVS